MTAGNINTPPDTQSSPQESHKLAEELERLHTAWDRGLTPSARAAFFYSVDKHLPEILAALRSSPSGQETETVSRCVKHGHTYCPECSRNGQWTFEAIAASGGAKGDGNG